MTRVVAVTGASGYLGGRIAAHLEEAGSQVVRMVRRPEGPSDRAFDLTKECAPEILRNVDVIVHCAYDFRPTKIEAVWRTNVIGTWHLLEAASSSSVERVIVLSSMSAYEGTQQLYGRAKLAIEAMTIGMGGVAVRPGLVVGAAAGGMGGVLVRLASLPVTPMPREAGVQYPVHEEDLLEGIAMLVSVDDPPEEVVGLAHAAGVPFADLLRGLAEMVGRRPPRLLPLPGRLLELTIRSIERIGIPLPLRSDSLAGLFSPAPFVPRADYWSAHGLHVRALGE